MTITTVKYPIAPPAEPLRGTLLDAASVDPSGANGTKWLDGNDLFESYNCMKFESSPAFCAPNAKDFDNSINWVDGIKFGAYGGVVCKAIGLDQSKMLSEVERVFAAGESTAVERALMAQRFVVDPGGTPRWPAPTDITPAGGAVKPLVGMALLEGYAGNVYVGTPTLHIPRTIASLLIGVEGIEFEGDALRSKLGSKIAAGAGYDFPNTGPTGAAAAAGEKWLYATGNVVILRGTPTIRQAMDTNTNDVFVLAERDYIAAIECFAAAVRVQVTA